MISMAKTGAAASGTLGASAMPGSLVFVNAQVIRADRIESGEVLIRDGVITAVGARVGADAQQRVDLGGAYLAPGLIDLQLNGGWGINLAQEPERVWELAEHLIADGVTAFCPTLVSCRDEIRERLLDMMRAGPPADGRARAYSLGAHLEGPILNPVRRGAHPATALRAATVELARSWRHPEVAYVTLAPELSGAQHVIEHLVANGVRVAAGHTNATTEELLAAEVVGLGWVTHLFNAMVPFNHRAPGPIGAVLGASRTLGAGLIADGVHVDPAAVAMAWRALGSRLFLVTDAVAPMGVIARGETIRLADGTLAGANLHLLDAVANFRQFTGCALHEAVTAASSTPANMLGDESRGRIEPSRRADFVVFDDDHRVIQTYLGGELATGRS
jgi:N-acetylglucosamine-6-phosphate deacetylase